MIFFFLSSIVAFLLHIGFFTCTAIFICNISSICNYKCVLLRNKKNGCMVGIHFPYKLISYFYRGSMDYYYIKHSPEEAMDGKPSEVHREGCPHLKDASSTFYLGYFCSCRDAIEHARRIYPYIAELCCDCCPEYQQKPTAES